jgi:hypothetical protein
MGVIVVASNSRINGTHRHVWLLIIVVLFGDLAWAAESGRKIAETGIRSYWYWEGSHLFKNHVGKTVHVLWVYSPHRGTIQLPAIGLGMEYVLFEGQLRFTEISRFGERADGEKVAAEWIDRSMGEEVGVARRERFTMTLRKPSRERRIRVKSRQAPDFSYFSQQVANDVAEKFGRWTEPVMIGCYEDAEPTRFVWIGLGDIVHGLLLIYLRVDLKPWSSFELVKMSSHTSKTDLTQEYARIQECHHRIQHEAK